MSHFLFIRNEPSIPNSLREVFTSPENRIILRQTALEAKSSLARGAFDAVLVYAEASELELKRTLCEIRDCVAEIYIVVLTPDYDLSLENAAFENGADLYFAEPIPTKTLHRLLVNQQNNYPQSDFNGQEWHNRPTQRSTANSNTTSTLNVLRDLSHILSFSLDYKAFTQHFILKLREHISFSRIGIFLESSAKQSLVKNKQSKHLTCIAALGLPSDLVDCFQLSRAVGIGRELSEYPRILHKESSTRSQFPHASSTTNKEFSILGCHLAIPITDREEIIGLAVLNGPVTGREYSEDELELLYLLMEELGLAIRNSRLHSELAQHGRLIENVMHSMSSGAIVFSENLEILYINDAAKRFLNISHQNPDRSVEFAELPSKLAMPVHRAVEKGELLEPFKITGSKPDDVYQVSIFPFTQKGELMLLPRPTMVLMEDFTKIEASKRTAQASSKTEIISLIAERFAHEIRNSLVPLSTHAQLIDKKINQPKFQASLKSAMLKETARIKRFSEQMLYLAQACNSGSTELQLREVILNAFERARIHLGNTQAKLEIADLPDNTSIDATPEALTHAFEEIFLNSMQSEPGEQIIQVQTRRSNEGILCIRIRDGGPGLPEDVIAKATEPFYTTRHTGVGLGLSVAHKVITEHNGYLHLNRRSQERDWDIEIELPSLLLAPTQ
ncbi:ATP-binding protein [Coraliomargarita algicola]|uniref:histidine kinase n=1 Tax=Coraliomargarita algicola TaxID=3092156 RepID=A0ABZ0RJT0_9BACT|nr:ATP-binding protein [Coraliomargarita sp. J2-16]WPJ95514.1 ATP-binding protein [Coraliomargarita sp. J2-16]